MRPRPGAAGVRRPARWLGLVAALFLPLQACTYFNGVYYARRYTKEAVKAERAGRTTEAAERWRLAQIHAESVLTRHPRSRWVDDAQLLRGRALVRLGAPSDAVVALEAALRTLPPGASREEAWLELGQANLALRRYEPALTALDSAAGSGNSTRHARALLLHGRTLMGMRHAGDALADFRASTDHEALVERVRAALAVRDTGLAVAFAEDLLTLRFRAEWWLPLLDSLGASGLQSDATRLVDALRVRRDVDPGSRGRLLLADGDRLLARGHAAAAADRFAAVVEDIPDSSEARAATLRLIRLELRSADRLGDESPFTERLGRIIALGGAPAQAAADLQRLLNRAASLAAGSEHPDACWFLRAELLRDSVGAPVLAARAFAAMAERFPDSPWTPKGLLAAIIGGYPAADSLRALLRERYARSPYALLALGSGDDPELFTLLEDSLRTVLAPLTGETTAATRELENVPQRGVGPAAPNPQRPPAPTTRRTVDP